MTTKAIREKLVKYLQVADDKKVKAIYIMAEDEINTFDNAGNESFVEELITRSKSFADGTAKTFTWEETKQAGIDRVYEK